MISSSIYLTGSTIEPARDIADMTEPDWRFQALTKLQHYGLKVINPLQLAWSANERAEWLDIKVRRSLDLIDQCDALLANLAKPSYGTAMEIFYAHRHGKLVTVVGNSPFSPWVLSHSQVRFEDIDHALNYLIDEPPKLDPVAWALQYEGVLAERYEELPPAGEPDYQFLGGELPVLVMAPHATAYFHNGEFQSAHAFTGSMAALLNKMTRCHALKSNYCCVADPCWHLETPMRRAFSDIVHTGQIGMVMLLLEAEGHENSGIHIESYGPNKEFSEELGLRLSNKLSALERVGREGAIRAAGPLVGFTAEELAIPIVIVRMHKRYRMPRLQPIPFVKILHLLKDFIEETGLEFLRGSSFHGS